MLNKHLNKNKKMKRNLIVALIVVGVVVALPLCVSALSGTNAGDVKVKIYAELGDDWFKVATKHADQHGVLELKNAIPGWYRMEIDEDDVESSQSLAARIRMRDRDGARIKDSTEVKAYMDIGGVKTQVATYETDKSGWFEMSGVASEAEYYLDVEEDFSVSDKDGKPRIKVKAKVDDSEWFRAMYKRTDENKVLEIENVLPAKYKFKYKSDDAAITDPFTLKIRMVDEDGRKIREETDFNLYAYVEKQKVPIGTITSDRKGWLVLPGTMTGMKYKISID